MPLTGAWAQRRNCVSYLTFHLNPACQGNQRQNFPEQHKNLFLVRSQLAIFLFSQVNGSTLQISTGSDSQALATSSSTQHNTPWHQDTDPAQADAWLRGGCLEFARHPRATRRSGHGLGMPLNCQRRGTPPKYTRPHERIVDLVSLPTSMMSQSTSVVSQH